MNNVTDDLTLYGPTGAGDRREVNQVQRCPETQNRSASIKVDEQLPGPQSLIQVHRHWMGTWITSLITVLSCSGSSTIGYTFFIRSGPLISPRPNKLVHLKGIMLHLMALIISITKELPFHTSVVQKQNPSLYMTVHFTGKGWCRTLWTYFSSS